MQINADRPAHLTYCLSVHPGESWEQNFRAIREHAIKVRDLIAPGKPFGLGLRLSNRAAGTLAKSTRLKVFKKFLTDNNLYVFTINGFPFGRFHGSRIKEKVYAPDWRTPERRDYTCRLADILSKLLPDGVRGSISTVPGSWKPWIKTKDDKKAMIFNLADTAAHLHQIQVRTAREICLGLEPEPDCFLETTRELINFITGDLKNYGVKHLVKKGYTPRLAVAILSRHIGACFDTCHLALQYEKLTENLRSIISKKIRVAKIQISSALRVKPSHKAMGDLKRFCDPVYLHQVKARTANGRVISRGDLEQALEIPPAGPQRDKEWRVHCHVPLYFTGTGELGSTAAQITPKFLREALRLGVEHFEIETYTYAVLPSAIKQSSLEESIVSEYRWLLEKIT